MESNGFVAAGTCTEQVSAVQLQHTLSSLPEFRFADVVARAHMKHLSSRKVLFDGWAQTLFAMGGRVE
jgi:hypothetical protein